MQTSKFGPILVLFLLGSALFSQTDSGTKPPGDSSGEKMAEDVYKDIKVFKGFPAGQIMPAMQFMNDALGVGCNHCHLKDTYEANNANKELARTMIRMQFDLNKTVFGGGRAITCYSCHRNEIEPPTLPPVGEIKQRTPEEAPATAVLPVDAVLQKYLEAIGGAAVVSRISSRVEKGTISFGETHSPIDVYCKAPNKRMSDVHSAEGDSITAYDGRAGWLGGSKRAAQLMSPEENYAAGLDAQFAFPTNIKQAFLRLRPWRAEKIAGRDVNVLLGITTGRPDTKLYFDKETGLLTRMIRYAETPLGRIITQIDYSDYREQGGMKVPFRWSLARPGAEFTVQIDQVQQNVPIDDAKFAAPMTTAGNPEQRGH